MLREEFNTALYLILKFLYMKFLYKKYNYWQKVHRRVYNKNI